ncbi:hypothetical protein VCHE48_0850 [Vibrio cholerae HE48]|nr:hypothetical protein FORC73_3535 [Vibrio cholerae]EGR10017.1 hypothetical protein VCHE48_0850 [Vibrio cholerae HE48]EJH66852.1 hypothetical protein VCHE25_0807 [Vibrio cholerae HE-25]EKK87882.1 hypothetical protein VCCP1035_3597 [Vibrio cholerae CP1035(8)]CQB49376.1 hypothetical protein [Vibrio cholerae]
MGLKLKLSGQQRSESALFFYPRCFLSDVLFYRLFLLKNGDIQNKFIHNAFHRSLN